jgi:hypothetical protein
VWPKRKPPQKKQHSNGMTFDDASSYLVTASGLDVLPSFAQQRWTIVVGEGVAGLVADELVQAGYHDCCSFSQQPKTEAAGIRSSADYSNKLLNI